MTESGRQYLERHAYILSCGGIGTISKTSGSSACTPCSAGKYFAKDSSGTPAGGNATLDLLGEEGLLHTTFTKAVTTRQDNWIREDVPADWTC